MALALAGPAGRTGESPRQMPGTRPGHPRPPGSLRQLVTRTRRLGTAPASGPYTACRGNSTYALDPSAAVDWDEFRILAGHRLAAAGGGSLQAVPPRRREAQPRGGVPRVPGTGGGR